MECSQRRLQIVSAVGKSRDGNSELHYPKFDDRYCHHHSTSKAARIVRMSMQRRRTVLVTNLTEIGWLVNVHDFEVQLSCQTLSLRLELMIKVVIMVYFSKKENEPLSVNTTKACQQVLTSWSRPHHSTFQPPLQRTR